MAHQVVWEKMAIQGDDGSDTIYKRGEILPDGVNDFLLGVYVSTGAVRFVEDAAKAEEETEELSPSFPPGAQTGEPDQNPEPPATSANKPEWVEYAVSRGMDRAAADRLSKDALINRYGS
jgi:hypothetical protein